MSTRESSTEQRSLYRRHRPRTFAEVVGQEPVVRTLRHAVERDKVHHAYLFVGSRGTGKTSMAKILAACLNCERGPTIEPCGECESCLSIAAASSLDVIEMDAASNNSVDDIRELRESVAYAPVSGRRKVYILDEAHMLSTAAWNAFLKTLEEPPPNTVFVLATTEAQKVPATVVDRCHRFDFHRPTVEQIASVVRRAAQAEGVAIPPEAVAALARAATGSFRDALGTLEQLVTYSGGEIALDDVLAVLGVADARLLEGAVDAAAAGDSRRALQIVAECAEQGRDAASFAGDLESRARDLLVVQTLGAIPPELSLTPEADAALAAQAERVDAAVVVRLLDELGAAMEAVRAGADARTRLELALVKAAKPEVDSSLRALLDRIERLERAAPGARVEAVAAEREIAPSETRGPVAAAADPPSPPAPEPAVAEPSPEDAVEVSVASIATEPEPEREPQSAAAEIAEGLAPLLAWWPAVVDAVRSDNAMLGACIEEARPVDVKGEDLVVAFSTTTPFHKKKAESADNRAAVAAALHDVTGRRWRLSYELHDGIGPHDDDESAPRSEEEWVARFMQEFDAEELSGGEQRSHDDALSDAAVTSERKGA
ncbi:MAG TPA: DNA polymerase III subunit gamma/tau [Solirubrobacteraceae bacterium]|nr:DNA polymerase III subunit gamma/tau [Solirubrobacteraceae bacterium]